MTYTHGRHGRYRDRHAGAGRDTCALGTDAGLNRYDESYANAADLHAVDKERFTERRGLCSQDELGRIESLVRVYLGL